MQTLQEYASHNFPHRMVVTPDGDAPFTDHTVVARAFHTRDAIAARDSLRRTDPDTPIAIATVQPNEPTIVPTEPEDKEGVSDLPKRRIAASAFLGAAIVGVIVGALVWIFSTFWAGLITGAFAALLAGVVSAVAGGGSRYAGNRAWEQRNAPSDTVTLIAALADDEAHAIAAARAIEQSGIYDIRIVDANGAWHTPTT
jgi:hypothetical protein